MSDKIRNLGKQSTRVETGPVQFGDDWPGYFIRGDNAFVLYMTINSILGFKEDSLLQMQLRAFANDLLSCNVNDKLVEECKKNNGPVTESADVADLKPAAEKREGSSPSGPTSTPYQQYIEGWSESELPIQVGQQREFAIDGFGPMEGQVVWVSDTSIMLQVSSEYHTGTSFELDWDKLGPNTWVGWVVGGEEYKKWLAQAEQEAISGKPV